MPASRSGEDMERSSALGYSFAGKISLRILGILLTSTGLHDNLVNCRTAVPGASTRDSLLESYILVAVPGKRSRGHLSLYDYDFIRTQSCKLASAIDV